MIVKLRIVGLYFNEPVTITDRIGLTVKDVMDEYIRLHDDINTPGGLKYHTYISSRGTENIGTIIYHFNGIYNFDGNNTLSTPPDGRSLGDKDRLDGIYQLSENLEESLPDHSKTGLAWQYYVVSPGGKVKSKTGAARSFKSFGEAPDYNIQPDDTIIWRLVAIAREPNFL
jgi:hypothetical protein